ncbi:MAG: hypothetical protein PVI88_04680 [Nitrosopumilaceae archaeon]|jgi:hypothetical protein
MKKKFLIIPVLIIIITIFVISQPDSSEDKNQILFHVTLADPAQYNEGVYSSKFELDKGDYSFKFVPNGDSPQVLSIELEGEEFQFREDFKLNGTLHETGISEYYTWDYDGKKIINVPSPQEIFIQINPNGNIMGSVSVDIIEN